ncbi:MAG: histidine kinase N-terminal 7TM domain-containing protein [Nitrospirales bacterium]|nr:hypothetical protein [Nitrospira sp.]MCB9711203.1 hypothetical protein [Nitrospiraceae bacterium]MDR4486793.1 hypothetical protein [Nitrospirales bacterium]
MEFFALSGLLNAAASIGLASFIFLRSPKDPRHWTFGLFGIATAIWSLGYFFWQISETHNSALLNLRILMGGAIFIPVTFLHHVLYLLKKAEQRHRLILWNYGLGGGFFLLDFTPLFVAEVQPLSIFPFWGVPGFAFHFCLIWWLGLVIYAHILLCKAYLHEKGLPRRQFLFLLVGSTIGYIGGATNFPLWYEIYILPYGTACFAIYISLVAYTLVRFHWLDFSVYVERGLSYFAILLLISQPIYPALLLAQKSVFGAINLRYSLVQLFLHILTVVGAYQMKVGTKGAVARTILKGRELKLHTLSQFSSKVSNCQDLRQLGGNILETLGKGVGASHAALFIFDYDKNRFDLVAGFGFSPGHLILNKSWTLADDLPQLMMFEQCSISVEEMLKNESFDSWGREIGRELDHLGIGWCFPFFGNGQLLGFLVLGPISQEFLRLLGGKAVWDTIIQESTLALENIVLRNEVNRSQQLLCQVDRFRSLEVMTQGLTQELKYPLRTMKGFVQLAKLRKDDEEFMRRLEKVVGEDLQSVEQLIEEIQGYVRSVSQSMPSRTCLHDLVDISLVFLASHPIYRDVIIEKHYSSALPYLSVDRQAFIQVFFNGLLFLLKDQSLADKTLYIDSFAEPNSVGKMWVKVRFAWFSQSHAQLCAVSLEGVRLEESQDETAHQNPWYGLRIANRIIQKQFGAFWLLMLDEAIVGFQIDLPVTSVPLEEAPCLSFPYSSSLNT